jgi:lipid-binding SYLF domain-containing protein
MNTPNAHQHTARRARFAPALRLALTAVSLAGLAATSMAADRIDNYKRKAEIRQMCDDALATLYKQRPALKARIAKSAGYGCFSSYGFSFLIGGAGGQGLVRHGGEDTYMNMAQASVGLDAGIKDYREVLVFKDRKTLDQFIAKGWEFGGQAQATAKANEKGVSREMGEITTGPIEVYPMTKAGLQAGVSAGGRKYWKDGDLN